jgi:hypothetical protein
MTPAILLLAQYGEQHIGSPLEMQQMSSGQIKKNAAGTFVASATMHGAKSESAR